MYDKAVRYDLEADLKQVIKPELTGPLGARLFDKAVFYKSTLMYAFYSYCSFENLHIEQNRT